MIKSVTLNILVGSALVLVFVSATPVFVARAEYDSTDMGGGSIDLSPTDMGGGSVGDKKLVNPLGSNASTLDGFVKNIAKVAMRIGAVVAAIFIIWSGFKFVTSMGNPTEIAKAKSIFWYTIIGTAILLGAVALADILTGTIPKIFGS